MFTAKSEQSTLKLASFIHDVKKEVLKRYTNPRFNVFNFQYLYKHYNVVDATAVILADLDRLKSA